MKRNPLLRSLLIVTSIFVAGHFLTSTSASQTLTGNHNLMSIEVQAVELEVFTGEWSYVQNEIGAPEAAVIKTDDTVAVALFKDTIIKLKTTTGITPVIILGTEVAAVAPAPAGDGILIAGTQLGEGLIQVQNPVNGTVTNVVVSVLDSGLGAVADNVTAVTTQTTQASAKYYYYTKEYTDRYGNPAKTIKYTDGVLSVSADEFRYQTPSSAYKSVLYMGNDGMLTLETYQGIINNINQPYLNGDDYLPHPDVWGNHSKVYSDSGYIYGNCDNPDKIVYITTDGKYGFVTEYEPVGAPFLPVRVITKGNVTDKWTITYVYKGVTYERRLLDLPWYYTEFLNEADFIK